jgi:hypothetical protein
VPIAVINFEGKNATVGEIAKCMKEDRMSYTQTKKIIDELKVGELIICQEYQYRSNKIACRYQLTDFGVSMAKLVIDRYPHLKDKFNVQ